MLLIVDNFVIDPMTEISKTSVETNPQEIFYMPTFMFHIFNNALSVDYEQINSEMYILIF